MQIDIPPRWRVVGPDSVLAEDAPNSRTLRVVLEPGVGFGDGSHATTVLCMQAITALSPRDGRPWRMLDFGSGSGILAIAAAKLGAHVRGIEIDACAIEHARGNALLNGVAERITFGQTLEPTDGTFDLVVANILRSVLLAHAPALTERLSPEGALVLSGLVSTDVPEVSVHYASLIGGRRPEVYEREHWRALAWRAYPSGLR